ncbi:DUF397 domain-containing protein [Streptomyces somaliensis]|uniref:DUF397 domain-containing protein n=1 Tax=Streptomyces somaliensis TaxID=78355 RepID=UPI0020CFC282|nr:DUF397 domain-containing protein [Streptomyces somaliensis]MCP9944739.1 DUF397 domain-containing protein [Streptomyces somaliensis]MCP9962038.1 DUF397 domain-containing protein [Streptomyces somaliensis]MCP9974856.1 DUF397 domain-containing protein [Streptomyces somaliensis]
MNTLNSGLVWVKSSYSAGNGGDCVEVARTVGAVHVRDSKRAGGPVLTVAPTEWNAFLRIAVERD